MRDYHFHNDPPLAARFPALPILLEQIIVDNDNPPFHDVSLFLPLAIALTTAVHHTHRAILAHGRITPAIILLEAVHPAIRMRLLLPDEATAAESQPRLPYIAPEQTGRTNHPVDHRADLYALGVIFYQLLTGNRHSAP